MICNFAGCFQWSYLPRCKDRDIISNLQILNVKFMANAQNIDKIFAELAKKVQREVQIDLPRKVGIIAKNHFTDNFRKGGFVDTSLEPWQTPNVRIG